MDTPRLSPPPAAPSPAPEWIDISPDAPGAAERADERAADEKWKAKWHTWKVALAVVAVAAATRWVTWRQTVAHQPPVQVSAVAPAPASTAPASTARSAKQPGAAAAPPSPARPARRLVVHIVGRVRRAGVVEIAEGSRLRDALHRVGGPQADADLEAINLAEPLQDGRQYFIPARRTSQSNAPSTPPQNPAPSLSRAPAAILPRRSASIVTSRLPATKTSAAPARKTAPDAPIDLNRADALEMEQLPGVGPATAQKIVEFRAEIGGFKSVEDLDGVKGIGPKKLERIRPHVFVR